MADDGPIPLSGRRASPPAAAPRLSALRLSALLPAAAGAVPQQPEDSSSQVGGKPSDADQQNKIFVGGLPQDWGAEDLRRFFGHLAPVKRAWVQKHKTSRSGAPRLPAQNHRGFGWVVFQHASTRRDGCAVPSYVDQLLGSGDSRRFDLGDGRQVDVKRAKDSKEMKGARSAAPGPAAKEHAPETRGPPPTMAKDTESAAPAPSAEGHATETRGPLPTAQASGSPPGVWASWRDPLAVRAAKPLLGEKEAEAPGQLLLLSEWLPRLPRGGSARSLLAPTATAFVPDLPGLSSPSPAYIYSSLLSGGRAPPVARV